MSPIAKDPQDTDNITAIVIPPHSSAPLQTTLKIKKKHHPTINALLPSNKSSKISTPS
jgi:hypothetical protein